MPACPGAHACSAEPMLSAAGPRGAAPNVAWGCPCRRSPPVPAARPSAADLVHVHRCRRESEPLSGDQLQHPTMNQLRPPGGGVAGKNLCAENQTSFSKTERVEGVEPSVSVSQKNKRCLKNEMRQYLFLKSKTYIRFFDLSQCLRKKSGVRAGGRNYAGRFKASSMAIRGGRPPPAGARFFLIYRKQG